jgi:hypothetical protein
MPVATEYHNYQQTGTSDPHYNKGESPAIHSLMDWLVLHGGQSLGTFGVRDIRGGSTVSTHADGAAGDWRYANPGRGRVDMLNTIMPTLINHSQELGVQMIGDYIGCRIWKADRANDVNHGWKIQTPSPQYGMGQSWAAWLHIEIHPRVWSDGRPVDQKLGVQGFPPFDPAHGQFSLYPWATNKPVLRLGSQGDPVKYMQGVFKTKLGYGIGVDGGYGNVTTNFVRWFQGSHGLKVDNIVGPATWAAIDKFAKT